MITKNQQLVINSITSNFELLNSKFTETSTNAIALRIMEELNAFNKEALDLKANTEAYEIANNTLFEDLCNKVEELTSSLDLKFRRDDGHINDGEYTEVRQFDIIFPQFKDNSRASGEVSIGFYIKSFPARINSNIKGLFKSGFTYDLKHKKTEVTEHNLFDVISEEIIQTYKNFKK
jgi:hypothetical protein